MTRIILLLGLFIAIPLNSQGQLPIPRNISEAYTNGTRDISGTPGQNYWQNAAAYDIDVRFDPATRELKGAVKIMYQNNSPDTLEYLLLKLYPNVTKKGSARDIALKEEDVNEGVIIKSIQVGKKAVELKKMIINGVNARLSVEPVNPGNTVKLKLDYSYILSKDFPKQRAGQVDEASYFLAYFFPRIAVYDDIEGWDWRQFLGVREFYNDFSDFRVSITVPDPYIVWATGDLVNRNEVFSKRIVSRISNAENNDEEISIIGKEDLLENDLLLGEGENTFTFEAKNVTDFAFGTSSHYVWKSSSVEVDKETKRRTRVDAVYNPEHENYDRVLSWNRQTVKAMSEYYPGWPYPYNHETVFEGRAQMEFPMMVNMKSSNDSIELCQVTIHEVFHTMFPFYMGINQNKYGWMDEGITTAGEYEIYPYLYPGEVNNYGLSEYEKIAGTDRDYPIMVFSQDLSEYSYIISSYPKTGIVWMTLRDLLGDELFFQGLHSYIENWHGKHPIPWDMFYSFNTATGKDLNWFWNAWFFESGYPDLTIEDVNFDNEKVVVSVFKKGNLPVPVHLYAEFSDGSNQIIHKNVSVWKSGNKTIEIQLNSEKELTKLILDGPHIPDVNKKDNVWLREF